MKVTKNKVAPPFKRAEFDIMFGEGISQSGEIIDLGVAYDIIKKSGSWFSYEGTKLGQGRDAAKATIADNPELAAEIGAKIATALRGDSSAGQPAPKSGRRCRSRSPASIWPPTSSTTICQTISPSRKTSDSTGGAGGNLFARLCRKIYGTASQVIAAGGLSVGVEPVCGDA